MTTMTKEELINKVAELEAALKNEKSKSVNMKTRVRGLIDSGVNTMDGLAVALNTTNKNVSSVLTAIRKELSAEGKTIITQVHNGQTMVAVIDLSVLGW